MNSKKKKQKRPIRSINSELPGDIIEVILSKIPFFNLPSCRIVCKAWNNLLLTRKFDPSISISNLLLAHISPYRNLHCADFDPKHLERMNSVASFEFLPNTSISIVNSCHGLLCLVMKKTNSKRTPIPCILNPITNEYFKLPISKSDRFIHYYYGLGFSPKTNQYKLARARTSSISSGDSDNSNNDDDTTLVEIFAFGCKRTRKWTPVGFFPSDIQGHGVYFNGGLYWLGVPAEDDTHVIYRLDIEDEKLQQNSVPEDGGEAFIGIFNDALYLTVSTRIQLFFVEYHVWKMEQDFSWTEAFVVPKPENVSEHRGNHIYSQLTDSFHFQLIKSCEHGKILCLDSGLDFILYDSNETTARILTRRQVEIKKHMWVHQIDSFNFNSLLKILAGNC